MIHPAVQEAIELLSLAEAIGDEDDIAAAGAALDRISAKAAWTIAHQHCDHAYGICQSPRGEHVPAGYLGRIT